MATVSLLKMNWIIKYVRPARRERRAVARPALEAERCARAPYSATTYMSLAYHVCSTLSYGQPITSVSCMNTLA
jgi:hypothetical protein